MRKSTSINQFFQGIDRTDMTVFFCCMLSAAMTWSFFLMSVAMWGFVAVAFLRLDIKKIKLRLGFEVVNKSRNYRLALASITVPFFLVLISGLWSHDIYYWLERMRIKLPFLILPLAFYFLPKISRQQFYGVLYFTLLFITGFTFFILANYALHFTQITELLNRGTPMPFMRDHIRYSIQLSFTIFIGLEFIRQKFYAREEREIFFIKILVGFLIAGLHIIAVRSGLIIFYVSIFFFFFLWLFYKKRWRIGLVGLVLTFFLPYLAYHFIPSFHNRMNYARWDFLMYKKGEGEAYSDAGRWISIDAGIQVLKKEPIFGVGAGDVFSEIGEVYVQQFNNWSPKLPHNQLLIVADGTGIVGLIIFLLSFFLPLYLNSDFRKQFLVLFFYLNVFLSFWLDMPFEAAFGVAFYVFYLSYQLSAASR